MWVRSPPGELQERSAQTQNGGTGRMPLITAERQLAQPRLRPAMLDGGVPAGKAELTERTHAWPRKSPGGEYDCCRTVCAQIGKVTPLGPPRVAGAELKDPDPRRRRSAWRWSRSRKESGQWIGRPRLRSLRKVRRKLAALAHAKPALRAIVVELFPPHRLRATRTARIKCSVLIVCQVSLSRRSWVARLGRGPL